MKISVKASEYAINELIRTRNSVQFVRYCHKSKEVIRWDDAITILDEMQNKLTPTLVDIVADGYSNGELVYDSAYCPNPDCGHEFEYDYDKDVVNYCPECGQALKWDIREGEDE